MKKLMTNQGGGEDTDAKLPGGEEADDKSRWW